MASVLIIGTLDTKGREVAFLKEAIEGYGHRALVMDAGVLAPPPFVPDITRDAVAEAAGVQVGSLRDRGEAVTAMTRGAEIVAQRLHADGRIDAVMGLGGSAGTT